MSARRCCCSLDFHNSFALHLIPKALLARFWAEPLFHPEAVILILTLPGKKQSPFQPGQLLPPPLVCRA